MTENLPPWLGLPRAASAGFIAQHRNSEFSYKTKKACHVLSTLLENRLYYFALLLSKIFLEYKFNQAGTNLLKLTN